MTDIIMYGCCDCPWTFTTSPEGPNALPQMRHHHAVTGHNIDLIPALVEDPFP